MYMRLAGTALLSIVVASCVENTTPMPSAPSPPATQTGSPSPTPASPSPSPAPPTANVSIVGGAQTLTISAFHPDPITVSSGTTVTWMNHDETSHTTTSDTGVWDSGIVVPGGTFSRTFTSTGSFSFHCSIHPNMVGTVLVQ